MRALALGIGLNYAAMAPAASGPVSDLATLEIMGATPLLDATNDYSDATSRTGVNGNGWVAKATMPYLVGQTFDPTKISIAITDPGYDATGTTIVSRTITGRAILRRQYNAATSRQNSNNGVTYTVYFSLSEDIYQGSTLVSAAAAASFYGASAAGSVASLTNSSTVAYPKALFAWLNLQHDRATGSGFDVEAVAFHKHAMLGRQVARIEFIGADASAHTAATQTTSSTALSTIQTQGNIAEVYKATIPLSALTQADLCQVNAKVYPWIGDSSAILDLAADGVTWPTAQSQTKLRFLNDKSGTYGGAYAYVKAGASGGTVSLTAATARAAPYPTIMAAVAALVTFNNASRGHNDHSGGIVRLMDDGSGGAVDHVVSGDINGTAGQCWTDIEADPSATGAVAMQTSTTNNYGCADLIRFKCNIKQYHYFNSGVDPSNLRMAFDGVASFDTTNASADVPLIYRVGLCYQRNTTYTGTLNSIYNNLSAYNGSSRTQCALALGLIIENTSTNLEIRAAHAIIGCRFKRHTINPLINTNLDSSDGGVIYNNTFRDQRIANFLVGETAYTRGMAVVQNVFERAVAASTASCINFGGDGTTNAISNIVFQHQTLPGNDNGSRFNVAYTDVAGAAGVIKNVEMRFNLLTQYNCKSDTFTANTTTTGRVGNWRRRYTVGDVGNVVLLGDTGSSFATVPNADGGSWLGEAWPAATYNVTAAAVTWTNNQAGTSGGGSGTYTLTGGSNAAYDRVPAGLSVLAYDLAGVARKTDGTGAAGAYERP